MTLTAAGDCLKSLAVLDQRTKWVKCPFCDDEVTKLRPCGYWQGDKDEKVSHVCIECAESVKGLTYLAVNYPIPGVDVIRYLPPVYSRLSAKYTSELSYRADVTYGKWVFSVWSDACRLTVLEKLQTPDQAKRYDNTFQVWFALKKTFESDPVLETDSGLKTRKAERRSGWKV